jgi:hypothetical protein
MIAISDGSNMIGRRVKTQPPSEAWMTGDRFGEIVKVGSKFVHVRMERSGQVRKFLIYPAGDFDPIVPDLLNADGTGLALTPPPTDRAANAPSALGEPHEEEAWQVMAGLSRWSAAS